MHWIAYGIGTWLLINMMYGSTHPWSGAHVLPILLSAVFYFIPMMHLFRQGEAQYRYMTQKYESYLHEKDHNTIEGAHVYALRQLKRLQERSVGRHARDPLPFPRIRRRLAWYALIPVVNILVMVGIWLREDQPIFNGMQAYLEWQSDQDSKARTHQDHRMIHRATKRMHDPIPKPKEDQE